MAEPREQAARRVGSTVGKYRIEGVLGAGGMATVYLAVHRNGHKVAIKMLHPEVSVDADLRARFVREGYAANSIDHRGVVRVLDDDEAEDGSAFLVMELLEGETLHARCKAAGGKLPVREALSLAHQLLDVLVAAHGTSVVHRDIKPENLFLTHEGVLKVLDFGIARARLVASDSEPTRTGRAMGTPAYMAPEQAFGRSREVDERTDVFACGATLFTLISGKLVHEAETAQELVVYAATRPARSLALVAPDAPPAVIALVDRALAFERDARWTSAAEMRDALASVYLDLYGEKLGGGIVPARPSRTALESAPTLDATAPASTPPPAVARSARARGRWLAVAGAAGLAVALVTLGARRGPVGPAPLPSASSALTARTCTSASCAAGGRAAVCRHDACVPLESEDCTVMARPEDVGNEATIWVGTMFPTRGPMAPDFAGSLRAVDLARRDFLEVSNGLPGARPGTPARPLAVVSCDDGADPARAARHLIDDVGVPAVIGFARSKEVVDLALSLFNPRGVLALASNTAPMLSDIPMAPGQPRMVWRTTISGPALARAMAAMIDGVLEPELRRSHVLGPGESMRVALVRSDNTVGIGLSDALMSSLRFNGVSVAENGGRYFHEITIKDEGGVAGRVGQDRAAAAEVASFRPHVLIDTAGGGALVGQVESAWPAGERSRPHYVVQGTLTEPEMAAAVTADPTLARRLFGVDTATETSAVAKFVLRYNAVYAPKITPLETSDAPYDAFYVLAYTLAALGETAVDGRALALAIPRLHGRGPKIDVGPAGIYPAVAALARGDDIDLVGTATSLDFDPATGDAPATYATFCFRPEPGGRLVPSESGKVFDSRTGAVSGELHCP